MHDFKKELKVLTDALDTVGTKGEVEVAERIRGSALLWGKAGSELTIIVGMVWNFGENS